MKSDLHKISYFNLKEKPHNSLIFSVIKFFGFQ